MALPESEWYSISKLADEWKISEEDVEHYLETRKLVASIRLPITMLSLIYIEAGYDEEKEEYFDELDEPELFDGIFEIDNYNLIVWNAENICDFHKNKIRLFRWDDEYREDFEFTEHHIIRKNEIKITVEAKNEFETTFCNNELSLPAGLVLLDQTQETNNIPAYLNEKTKYFSKELETAISAWIAIYHEPGGLNKYRTHKSQILSWIEKNRQKEYELSGEAIGRIATMVNFDKRNKKNE